MKRKNKKRIIVVSTILGSLLITVALANKDALQSTGKSESSRSIASSIFGELRSASLAVEKRVASELAPATKKRKLASIGRPATSIENFRFGVLEGKYAIKMDGEKIREVDFIDTPESDGRPSALGDRSEFFNKYGALFGLTHVPERVAVDVVNGKVVETYKVVLPGVPETIVKLTVDNSDRLISLHTEKTATLKIF